MVLSALFAHRAAVIRLCDVKSAWWKTATVTLSYLRGTRGRYRSCNPLWADTIHPSPSLSRANRGAPPPLLPSCGKPRSILTHGTLALRDCWRDARNTEEQVKKLPKKLVAAVHVCIMCSEDREIWPDLVFVFTFRTAVWIHYDCKKTWILHVEFGCSFEIPKKSILEVML